MTKKNTFLLLIFCLFCLNIYSQKKEQQTFKIISYNIWNGLSEEPECRPKFIKWINEQKPDVLALEELVDINEEKLSQLAAEYGHHYVAIVKEEGYPVGITSRKPIQVISKNLEGFWHGMLHVKTYDLDLIVTHLSPFEWKFRLQEAQLITEYIQKHNLKNYMVMGDLNAHSPFDAEEIESHTTLKSNMEKWDKQNPQYGNTRGSRFDYSVLSKFLSTGMADAIQMFVPAKDRMTYPAAYLNKLKWDDPSLKQCRERLDYILVSPLLVHKCINAAVHNGQENEGISDHYPVSLILDLEK